MPETLQRPAVRSAPRPPAAPSSGLRQTLRTATADAHARLDARLAAHDLTDRNGYRRFLIITAAALVPLEDALEVAGVARVLPDWPARARSAALLADLAALGASPARDDRPSDPLPATDDAALFGTLYVLEGSRLGARLLHARVSGSPDALVRRATAYLGHGAGEKLWQRFVARLEQAAPGLDRGATIAAANHTFALFARAAGSTMDAP